MGNNSVNVLFIITYALITLILITVCTDRPPKGFVEAGMRCQDIVTSPIGYDIKRYCAQDSWIIDQFCGETCAKEFGLITDPNCGEGKMFLH